MKSEQEIRAEIEKHKKARKENKFSDPKYAEISSWIQCALEWVLKEGSENVRETY